MAKIMDLRGEWAAAIGKAFVAFGSIEYTTVVCLRQIPKDNMGKFTKDLRLTSRINLLIEILEPNKQEECIILSNQLQQAKILTKTRNLIAHNPLVLSFYKDEGGGYTHKEHITAIHKEDEEITLAELQDFAEKSTQLSIDLISSSISVFRVLGVADL